MTTLAQIEAQESLERRYSRKHIDGYIRDFINQNPVMQAKMEQGVSLIQDYMNQDYYDSKNARIAQLKPMDIPALVLTIFTGIAYCLREELFTSVTAQLASRLKFSDKTAAITTVAELVAVLCNTDAFDINKANKGASLMVKSLIPLEGWLVRYIENSRYLPPMVCEPLEVKNNYSSGYLTHNDSLILGSGNHHEGDLCLDVINKLNRVQLRLDTQFLSTVEEDPSTEFTIEWAKDKAAEKGRYLSNAQAKIQVEKALENWHRFKKHGYELYTLLVQTGNCLHLTHKVDKRGRIYAQGFHITSQGSAFKKASLELYKEELVTGVPA